ncbi:MAG TPA: adenylate kinase [Thermomicrobiales bacterium]|nr:adenylate kinase [Thermomicrobiales bacterium]
MNVILLGPQGVGKGTQGELIAPRLRLARVATGDLLRAAIAAGSELGRLAQGYYDRGALVPDEVVIGLVVAKLQGLATAEPPLAGALFDGFPRTRPQAEGLDAALAGLGQRIDRVINIDAPREVLIARLTERVTCRVCGTIYNLKTKPPKVPCVCDVCGSKDALVRRADDTPEAVGERLRLYDEQTAPLLEYYRARGVVREVDGDRPIERVTAAVLAALGDGGAA